jgi:hypothetical protein
MAAAASGLHLDVEVDGCAAAGLACAPLAHLRPSPRPARARAVEAKSHSVRAAGGSPFKARCLPGS